MGRRRVALALARELRAASLSLASPSEERVGAPRLRSGSPGNGDYRSRRDWSRSGTLESDWHRSRRSLRRGPGRGLLLLEHLEPLGE